MVCALWFKIVALRYLDFTNFSAPFEVSKLLHHATLYNPQFITFSHFNFSQHKSDDRQIIS